MHTYVLTRGSTNGRKPPDMAALHTQETDIAALHTQEEDQNKVCLSLVHILSQIHKNLLHVVFTVCGILLWVMQF